jgi:hypothetical protein
MSNPSLPKISALLALAVLTGAAGCRWSVSVGPLGSDATVSGSWTVMGGAANAASCSAIGLDEVRLVVFEDGLSYSDPLLTAPCSAGMIDTRPTPVLREGTYNVRWEGYRAGSRVTTGVDRLITATFDGHVNAPSIDFVAAPVFDPIGTDASVEAHWTVSGTTPTTASCNALGIDRVRIAFFDGGTAREYTALTAACAAGAFDTRPERVIRAGTWTVQFQAVDRAGAVLGAGAMVTVNVVAGGHLSLYGGAPVDFSSGAFNPVGTDVTLRANWLLNERVPNVNTCFAVGVDTIRVLLHPPTDLDFNEGLPVAMADCSLGVINTAPMRAVRAGTYLVSVEALDADGNLVMDFVPTMTPFTVTAGADLAVTDANFMFPITLTVGLDWQRGIGGPPGDCTTAGVADMSYTLIDEVTNMPVFSRTSVACNELVAFEQGITSGFGTGRYRLYFEGTGSDRIKHWIVMTGSCDMMVVDNTNSIAYEQCFADYR